MKKSRFSEAKIVAILKELDGGVPATELARKYGPHPNTIRGWRDTYGGLETSDLLRLKQLEAENARMQRIIAHEAWGLRVRHDSLGTGRNVRTMNVVDDFTSECLALEPAFSFGSHDVVRCFEAIAFEL